MPFALVKNPVIDERMRKYKVVWALNHLMAVLQWNMETHMSEGRARARGTASGQPAMILQKATVNLNPLLAKAEKCHDLGDEDQGNLRVLRREVDMFTKIPSELAEERGRVMTEATVVWRKVRRNSDYRLFEPHLREIILE